MQIHLPRGFNQNCVTCPPPKATKLCTRCGAGKAGCTAVQTECNTAADCGAGGACDSYTVTPPCAFDCNSPQSSNPPSTNVQCGTSSPKFPHNLLITAGKLVNVKQSIVGGSQAEPHSFPWIAKILTFQPNGNSYSTGNCGGSLVNKNWIVTAAHCFNEQSEAQVNTPTFLKRVFVHLGAQTITQYNVANEPTQTVCTAAKVMIHPKYNKGPANTNYDVALIKLNCDVVYTDAIRPICLPTATDNWRTPTSPERMLISGWGKTSDNSQVSSELKQGVVSLVTVDKCVQPANPRGWAPSQIDASMLCAQDNGASTCQGDSGGPIAAVKNGKFTLAGVVSFGASSCQSPLPTVFAHIPTKEILDFVMTNTGGNN